MATKLDSKQSNYFISIAVISSFYFLREPMRTSFSLYVLWIFGFQATVYFQSVQPAPEVNRYLVCFGDVVGL